MLVNHFAKGFAHSRNCASKTVQRSLPQLLVFDLTGHLLGRGLVHINPTTIALAFLLGVLGISTFWGLRQAVFMAIIAALAFNYFFLPPVGTFAINDPHNWIALFAFLITAVTASELSERAGREARNANERRRELERLYGFSQQLLSSDNAAELLNSIPRYIVDSFGVRSAAIFLSTRADIYRSGPAIDGLESHDLQLCCLRGEPRIDIANHHAFIPLSMGMRVVGSLGISGSLLSRQTLDAIAGLIAIAIERASAIEKLTGNGQTRFVAISPDAKYLAYTSGFDKMMGIWLRQLATNTNVEWFFKYLRNQAIAA